MDGGTERGEKENYPSPPPFFKQETPSKQIKVFLFDATLAQDHEPTKMLAQEGQRLLSLPDWVQSCSSTCSPFGAVTDAALCVCVCVYVYG